MNCVHSETTSAGGMLDTLQCGDLELAISRQGAELFSIKLSRPHAHSVGFLYRDGILEAPECGWANHATVMGYYIHRLWQEHSDYDGATIRGGNHGFIRHFAFARPTFDKASCSLSYHVPSAGVPPDFYPRQVSCTITYRIIESKTLEIRFRFENEESARPAHLSFGLHPGFAVTNLATADFLMPPGIYRRLLAPGNFLSGEVQPIDHPGGPMPFDKEGLPGSYLLDLSELAQREFELVDHSSGRKVTFDLTDCPFLTLWSDGSDFICIEPCWGMPDSNPPAPFEKKTGIQEIPPLGTLDKAFRLTFDIIQDL